MNPVDTNITWHKEDNQMTIEDSKFETERLNNDTFRSSGRGLDSTHRSKFINIDTSIDKIGREIDKN